MNRPFLIALALTVAASLLPASASRAGEAAAWGRIDDLATGNAVAGPAGWLNYCMAARGTCGAPVPSTEVAPTPETLAVVERVQAEVNGRLTARAEPPGRDLWQVAPASGDCEDYALTKQVLLRAAGLPPGVVRLATVTLPNGEYHAVLTVATTRGTLVLDNLRAGAVPLDAVPYRWLRLEDPAGGLRWKELRSEPVVAAAQPASRRRPDHRDHDAAATGTIAQ
ncbi:MAG TPA: transglutaminase-like cysteine peptidase [Geminicoccaceae bacterium]|nr:transglutaminase-like cysteine peptidase [Geminicoccaceae bacterium]